MDNTELDRLEALARAATPGTWVYEQLVEVVRNSNDVEIADLNDSDDPDADGFYIAAVCPPVVLDLIAEIRRLRVAYNTLVPNGGYAMTTTDGKGRYVISKANEQGRE